MDMKIESEYLEKMFSVMAKVARISVSSLRRKGRDNAPTMYARTILCRRLLSEGFSMQELCRYMNRPSLRECIVNERYALMHGNRTCLVFNEIEKEFEKKWEECCGER